MHNRQYYTLIGSLPSLKRFDAAERVPINIVRLEERLKMLEPDDALLVERTADFLAWQRQPLNRTDKEVFELFQETRNWALAHPALMDMIEFRMNIRTVIAALRRRHKGLPAPVKTDLWGAGSSLLQIQNNWDHPEFKLGSRFPWISNALHHIEYEESMELEKLLMDLVWNKADIMARYEPFSFASLIAYLFKWDILNRWLSYNSNDAKVRFDAIASEVLSEYERPNDK